MNYLRELFKGKGSEVEKKALVKIGAAFIVGMLLLISANTLFAERPPAKAAGSAGAAGAEAVKAGDAGDAVETISLTKPALTGESLGEGYEEKLEARLGAMLSRVEGAGEVRVMLTLAQGHELVIAEDGTYNRTLTEETDAQGGRRAVEGLTTSGTKITIRGEDGSVSPLIIKTFTPKVEGVLITAQGGGSATVKEQLIKAAQTVLGVEPHKVQVLKSIGG